MSFARVAGTLAVLVTLCACSDGGTGGNTDSKGPRLPVVVLPSTTEGMPYSHEFTATGGVAPLRYSVTGLPPGFSFYSATGQLTGPATAAGEYTLVLGVKDAQGAEDSNPYALRVWPSPAVSTATLPAARVGLGYSFQLAATGGQAPLTWSMVDGAMPPGLALAEDGTLAGTPTGLGDYPLTLRVRDANGAQAQRAFSITLLAGGAGDGGTGDGGTTSDGGSDGGTQGPDAGTPFPLSVVNWNIEWFGDTTPGNGPDGPAGEQLQLDNVKSVLTTLDADFYAVAEVVGTDAFNSLKQQLPGYDGFLANDSLRVSSGYSYYGAAEQKVGVLFRSSVVSVRRAEVILTGNNTEFAGRPPLRVDLRVTRNGTIVDLVAIVLHMKATADQDSYDRRTASAQALKTYIDQNLPTTRVLVLGDWNDDVDQSIYGGLASPFANFRDDAAHYDFLTQELSALRVRSTVSNPEFIDHQLVTSELAAGYVANSTVSVRPQITNYKDTTSDHYPILSRFDFGQVAASLKLLAPNGGEVLTTGGTADITWRATGVANVSVDYTPDEFTWYHVNNVPASVGRLTVTLPAQPTNTARVRVSDLSNPDLNDVSDGTFSIVRPAPTVFINEVHAHEPPAGTSRDYAQEFVEIVNSGISSVDLTNWKINDQRAYLGSATTRHVFAPGTVLAPGKALVVFSGSTALSAGLSNAVTTPRGLFLDDANNNPANDVVYLQDGSGAIIDSFDYLSLTTVEGVSFNRSPDGSRTGSWVLHNTLPSGTNLSPGVRANGTSF